MNYAVLLQGSDESQSSYIFFNRINGKGDVLWNDGRLEPNFSIILIIIVFHFTLMHETVLIR